MVLGVSRWFKVCFVLFVTAVSVVTFWDARGVEFWFSTLVFIPGGILLCIANQTFQVTIDAEGISSYWYIGFGQHRLWESNRPRLYWKDVTALLQHPPAFLPPTLVTAEGRGEEDKLIGHTLPPHMTRWHEAVVYIADHVDPSIIDENMEKLIRKSRKRVGQETTPQAEEAGR